MNGTQIIHDARRPTVTIAEASRGLRLVHRHLTARANDTGRLYLTASDYCVVSASRLIGLRACESIHVEHGDAVWVHAGLLRHLPAAFVADPEHQIRLEYSGHNAAEAVVLVAETWARSRGSYRRPPEVTGVLNGQTLLLKYRGSTCRRIKPGSVLLASATKVHLIKPRRTR